MLAKTTTTVKVNLIITILAILSVETGLELARIISSLMFLLT